MYIRYVNTRNGNIYIIIYISGKWWFIIYACIIDATYSRYFHWKWFDNIVYSRDIIYITR